MRDDSTIVALSSGSLPSGVAVIRISGPACRDCLRALGISKNQAITPRHLALRAFRAADGRLIDRGLVAWFPAPNSFTGEDCAEVQVHGSRAVVSALLKELTQLDGVVLAGAGDFTRRAFENGKLDLTQIEGLGDLLAAETEGQRQAAIRRSEGHLRDQVSAWRHDLTQLRAEIEANLDFADEDDVPETLPVDFSQRLLGLQESLSAALEGYASGRISREGFRVVLAGAPNAGKSSLLNALSGSDEAIVSPEAGTTRDIKHVQLDFGGNLVVLTDMAGLRESTSVAETEGVRRARGAIDGADLVIWLDAPDAVTSESAPVGETVIVVTSKADLVAGQSDGKLSVSAETGQGLDALRALIAERAERQVGSEAALISRERDRMALSDAADVLSAAAHEPSTELLAEGLRLASARLARLTGEIGSEDVLDVLFSGFCIGK